MSTELSININKIATIHNVCEGDMFNVGRAIRDCERFGAQEINSKDSNSILYPLGNVIFLNSPYRQLMKS